MNREIIKVTNSAKKTRIAFIQACWHSEIVQQSHKGFVAALQEQGIGAGQVQNFEVPGVFEIPLLAKRLAKSGQYDVIVAAGFIVDGGIYRHEFVSTAVIDALMALQLEQEVPILSIVLTPQHFHETEAHQHFFEEHFVVKGREAANACLMVLENEASFTELLLTA